MVLSKSFYYLKLHFLLRKLPLIFMKNRFIYKSFLFVGIFFFCRCSEELEISSPAFLISTQINEFSSQGSSNCVFRYKLVIPFSQLDNDTQIKAITEGMGLWQKANKRLYFLQFSSEERCEVLIKFTEPKNISEGKLLSDNGLIRFPLVGQSISRKEDGKYIIYLNNEYAWTKQSLTKAIAYHAGIMLGIATSKNPQSVMYPYQVNEKNVLDKTDSIDVNRLYPLVCKDADFRFLPFTTKLNNYALFKIRLDKQGIIKISATGQIRVGLWLGFSTPDGLDKGLFNFPIGGYNIYPEYNHAAILYRYNNQINWKVCGSYIEFPTDGSEYLELYLDLNDKDKTDNSGFYDVTVNYK
jgi:Matrixin